MHHRRSTIWTTMVAVSLLPACGGDAGSDGLPTAAAWEQLWIDRQQLVPDQVTLAATSAEDQCSRLVGALRENLPDLSPTPDPAMRAAVDAWSEQARTIVFECSDDPATLERQYEELEVLAAEVEAALEVSR